MGGWLLRRQRGDGHDELTEDMMEAWEDTFHCKGRAHCDFCLGSARWHKALAERFDMPPFGRCPYGETLDAGKARRADRIVARVAAGLMSAEHALSVSEKLGLSLDNARA